MASNPLPPVPHLIPVLGPDGRPSRPWSDWFQQVFQRIGGTTGTTAAIVASDLAAHIADPTDAHDASAISNVPSGNLAATDVQGALNELQSDVDGRISSSLTSAKIIVGNASNVAAAVSMSGDASISNAGAVSIPTLVGDSGSGGTKGLVPAPAAGDAAALKFLKADATFSAIPSAGFPLFRVAKSSSQTPSGETTVTYASGDVTHDTGSGFDDANDKWVVPTGQDGYYAIKTMATRAFGANNWVSTGYLVNSGTSVMEGGACNGSAGINANSYDEIHLSAGDAVKHRFQTDGNNAGTSFRMTIHRIR